VQANQATAATGHGPSDRVPTLLLFGADPSEKSRLLSGWMAERPASERWALLRNGAILPADGIGGDHPLGASSGLGVSSDGLHISHLAGACACCLGGVAFTTALGRLLRQGPWDRLFIEVSAQAQGAALIDRIRSSALNDRLELLPAVLVLNQREASVLNNLVESEHSLTHQSIELARLLLIPRTPAPASHPQPTSESGHAQAPMDPNAALDAFATTLAARPPWPRRVRIFEQAGLSLATLLADLSEIEPLSTLPGHGVWRWPPSQRFDRRRLQQALAELMSTGAVLHQNRLLQLRGVFLTERDAYSTDSIAGPAAWRPSAWRLDSRLEVLVRGDFDPSSVSTILTAALLAP